MPIPKQRWKVETSHIVCHPDEYEVVDHFDLYRQLQKTADEKKPRVDRPPIGPLEFKFHLDDDGVADVAHAFFRGKDGNKRRFMRLRRVSAPDA